MSSDLRPSKVAPRGKDPTSSVYYKLLFFSVALLVAPLTAYYFSVDRLFQGNATYAGGLAAMSVNVVLVFYVVAAFREESEELVVVRKKDLLAGNVSLRDEGKKDK